MALEVVTGPAFSGKSRFARDQIDRRERAGAVGLILIGYTELFRALFPSDDDQLRDAAVSETGAPALVAGLYTAAVARAVARGLSGYITTDSPNRARRLADQVGAVGVLELVEPDAVIEGRRRTHVARLARTVKRADRAKVDANCAQTVRNYGREIDAGALTGVPRQRVRYKPRKGADPWAVEQWEKALERAYSEAPNQRLAALLRDSEAVLGRRVGR